MIQRKRMPEEWLWLRVALGLLPVLAGVVTGQPQVPPGIPRNDPASKGYTLPYRDSQLARRYKSALQLNEQGRPLEAIRQLQKLLQSEEDAFLPAEGAGVNPAVRTHRSQVAEDLEKLIRSHAAEYESQYGPEGRRLLDEALARGDWGGVAEVFIQFGETEAGRSATERLAVYHLDHGRPATAGLLWEEWIRKSPGEKLTARGVALGALCWDRAGNSARAKKLLETHGSVFQKGTLSWGGKTLALPATVEQVSAWIHAPEGTDQPIADGEWMLFRGNGDRTPQSTIGAPGLREQWRVSTTRWKDSFGPDPSLEDDLDYLDRLDRTFRNGIKRNIPLLPSMHPLIVGDTAVVRTYRNLQGIDLRTGQVRWESGERDAPIDFLMSQISPAVQQAGNRGEQLFALLRHRTWENLAYGTLSSDGDRIYSIEDSGFFGEMAFNNNPGNPLGPRETNRLVAHDLKTGRLVWDAGNLAREGNSLLNGVFFLGPPLPLEGKLYCLADDKEEVQLVVLNAADGKLLWNQTLVRAQAAPMYDPLRRFSGLSPTAVDGLVVCPTGLHTLVAVNPTTRALAWAYEFAENARTGRGRQNGQRIFLRGGTLFDQFRWSEGQPIVSGDALLVSPRESQELFCLDLYAGTLRWKVARDEALFVAGVHQEKVIVVGRNQIQALSLKTGEPQWQGGIAMTPPAGRGFFSGEFYFLPLANQELLTVDVERGNIRARRRWPGEKPLGNLVATERGIVSQSYDTVYGLPSLAHLAEDQHVSLTADPKDEPGWRMRAELRLHHGDLAGAFGDLRKGWEIGQSSGVRDLWVSAVLEAARIHPTEGEKWIAEVAPGGALDSPWGGAWALARSAQLKREGNSAGGLDLLLQGMRQPREQGIERLDSNYAVRRDLLFASAMREFFNEKTPQGAREKLVQRLEKGWQESAEQAEFRNDLLRVTRGIAIGEQFREALLAAEKGKRSLGGELILLGRARGNDPQTAAGAVARLAERALAAKEVEGREVWLSQLRTKYAAVRAEGEKTGGELLAAWGKGKISGGSSQEWPTGKVLVKQEQGAERTPQVPVFIAPLNEPTLTRLPYRLQVDTSDITTVVNAVDTSGKEVWTLPLMDLINLSGISSWRYASVGHLLFITNRQMLWGVDTLSSPPQILWRESLYDGQSSGYFDREDPESLFAWPRRLQSRIVDSYAGRMGGRLILANEEIVCVLKDNQILGLDPLTGKNLWKRFHVGTQTEIFSEGNNLCLVDLQRPGQAEVVSLFNGVSLGMRSIPTTGMQVMAPSANGLLLQTTDQKTFRLFSLTEQRVLWEESFKDVPKVVLTESDEFVAISPQGEVTISSLRDYTRTFTGKVELPLAKGIMNVPQRVPFMVMTRGDHVLLTTGIFPFRENSDGTFVGTMYGLERKSGKQVWKKTTTYPVDVYGRSGDHPLLALIEHKQEGGLRQGPPILRKSLVLLDLRTGEELHRYQSPNLLNPILMTADPEHHTVQVRHPHSADPYVVTVTFTNEPKSEVKPMEIPAKPKEEGSAVPAKPEEKASPTPAKP